MPLPSQGDSKAIGSYTAGCLQGGKSLYPDGSGYHVMRTSRQKFYGHPALIQFIEKVGIKIGKAKLKPILVGDLTQPRGANFSRTW